MRIQVMTSRGRPRHRLPVIVLGGALAIGAIVTTGAQQVPAGHCRTSGHATSGGTALPGVAVVVTADAAVRGVTSTDPDGSYHLVLPYGAYRLSAELTGFVSIDRDFSVDATTCATPIDLQFALAPRVPGGSAAPAAQIGGRFETLNVQTQPSAAAGLDVNPPDASEAAARLLLPPGFSTEGATQAVAVTGSMANLDRAMMNDRFEAIGRGEFDPVTGQFGAGFGPPGEGEGQVGAGGRGGPGRGGPGRGGPGGRGEGSGAFVLGGRGRGQNPFTAQANYTFGGSALDSAPYQLRPDSPVSQRPYARHSFGGTFGGPVRIPGVYNGTRRTTFTVNYSGTRGNDLFDQYATVPTEAMRAGDFSGSGVEVIDPETRQPFAGSQIPQGRISPTSVALLRFIPTPNLPGTSRNFHYTTTTDSANDNVSVRVMHSFTQAPTGRGGPGGRGGGIGGRGGPGGRGGRGGGQGTNVMLNAQVQYRRNDNEQNNVFPTLGGTNTGSTVSLPVGLNIQRRRQGHTITLNFTRTESRGTNRYAFVEDVAGGAGIIGIATDPFDWGVPQLSFSSLSSVRDMTPTRRRDTRRTFAYAFTQPFRNHTLRAGGDFRIDDSSNQTDTNARGAFVFTGLYSSGGSPGARGGGLDFADFLLGLPQQASVQYGPGDVRMGGRAFGFYLQDDWRRGARLTFSLGVRYELQWPFHERNGQMVNLDAAPDFSAVVPVVSGGTGAFSGRFPDTLVNADRNNLAPRVGFAWRAGRTIVRGGYGVSYNAGSYSSIARQMVGQPPFAVTNTSIGAAASPLTITDPFAGASPDDTANNYGVQKDYALGVVQTWNADVSRELAQVWNLGAGYTHTRGAALDIVRAPNRGPTGLRIEGVQPFLWQTSEGSSILHAGTFRLARRPVKGVGGGISYTLARSRDNASSIGGGGTVVAQDDRNLAAEWGLSSFDRRHQLSTNLAVELPFGPNRPFLNGGGTWAALLRDWRPNATFTWQSGTPLTPRVTGAAADVARGTNGTLRANYNGQEIRIADPTIDRFFNTAAFTVPDAGTFGDARRNLIVGPGTRLLNAQLARDVRLGGNRAVTIQLNANNVLNLVNYRGVDTVVNSPTFGQVLSVAGMRTMQLNLRFRF